MNIQYFEKLWQNDLSELDESKKFWDLRADEFNNHHGKQEGGKRREQVLGLLTTQGMLSANTTCLDIGCGPGKYSLELAKRSKQVVGIDISPKMLQYAEENAQQEQVNNATFELTAWETLNLEECGWQKKYDLVFASMCPGISSSDSLLKMCQASKKFCFLSGFVERKDELRDHLHGIVYGNDSKQQWGKNIYYAINVLWLSGYYPTVTYHDAEFEHVWPLEKAIELYSRQLTRMGKSKIDASHVEEKVADYLGSIAQQGIVSETVKSKIAWLHWQV